MKSNKCLLLLSVSLISTVVLGQSIERAAITFGGASLNKSEISFGQVVTGYYESGVTTFNVGFQQSEINTLSVFEDSKGLGMVVYPNPVNNRLQITHATWQGPVSYEIMAVDGRLMQRGDLSFSSSGSTIELGDLKPGQYLLKFTSIDVNQVIKIIKE